MNNSLMFSSAYDAWATPQKFFDEQNAKYQFDIDLCAAADSAKCEKFYSIEDDAFKHDWRGVCWMNPPYGRNIGAWIFKAYRSAVENGATVVCYCLLGQILNGIMIYALKAKLYLSKGV